MLKKAWIAHEQADAVRDVGAVGAPCRLGSASDSDRAQTDEEEERDDRDHPPETQFLGEHREQEIVVRLRKVEELLHPLSQTHSQPAPAADRDLGLSELETAPEGVGPRIGERKQALHDVGLVQGERSQSREGREGRTEANEQGCAAEEEHPERGGEEHRGGAVVGFEHDEGGDREQGSNGLQGSSPATRRLLFPGAPGKRRDRG